MYGPQKVMKKITGRRLQIDGTHYRMYFINSEKDVVDALHLISDEGWKSVRDLCNDESGRLGYCWMHDIDDYMKMHIDSIEKGDPKS